MARSTWDELDVYRGRPLALARAAHLTLWTDHVLSHDSAAYAWNLPLLRPAKPLVHITRPGVHGSRTEHGVKHHLQRRGLDAVYDLDGLRVTGLERTGLDIAREHGWLAGVVALDGALRLGANPVLTEAVLASMWSWPRVRQSRRAAQHARLGAESALETLGRMMVAELSLPEPTLQFPVDLRNGVAWCDLLVGRHVFEFDGRRKYVDTAAGGYADRSVERVLWSEKVRESDVTAHGLGVSRIFWQDCLGPGRRAGLARMASDFAATSRRLGTTLPADVAAYAEAMAGVRERRLRRAYLEPPPVPVGGGAGLWRRAG
ncbi:MAG: hypothetical protein ACRDPH_00345 [Marmoricola sp.]